MTLSLAGIGSLPRRKGGYDAVVSGLALNFFPHPGSALAEKLGLVTPGGTMGAFVWDYAGGTEFLRTFWDAAKAIEPKAVELDEGRRFPICNPDALDSLFRSAGAERVSVEALEVPTTFSSFEDYWRPFLGGTGPAPRVVSSLPEGRREALADELRCRLPVESGGTIVLRSRAWAAIGRRPSLDGVY